MTEREKVAAALRYCADVAEGRRGSCDKCPWRERCMGDMSRTRLPGTLVRAALDILRRDAALAEGVESVREGTVKRYAGDGYVVTPCCTE